LIFLVFLEIRSVVALLKRLQCSEQRFKELCLCLLGGRGISEIKEIGKIPMRLVAGKDVKEPGKTGSVWRIYL
jgi:hypothetical protein